MPSDRATTKLRLLVIGFGDRAVTRYAKEFERVGSCDLMARMLDAATYDELITKVPALMHGSRPIDACIVSVGVAHFQPFESKFLQLLLHNCRIVISMAPGCRSSAVERVKRNSAAHCNSTSPSNVPNRPDEATLKLVITLVLGSVQSFLYAVKDFHNELLWNNAALARDPPGTVLGIAGMGSVGKHLAQQAALHGVRIKYSDRRRLSIDDEAAYNAWYCHSVQDLLWESDVVCDCVMTDPVGASTTCNLLL
ncbi:hypothetical protein Purlil1_12690 [Purpureocillium lilacinum]|uniref:D-isomer specific 2-hydroxyacid dehydrogenase NAD-binding domain-containing protein n=1 Tax=Purpureocillium lilacinum TaxID=33203 RepID=A0ABR0BG55_PURLI|nr:hypothetical protein Purlil1_12690 [Purpureocillium lilacinum]